MTSFHLNKHCKTLLDILGTEKFHLHSLNSICCTHINATVFFNFLKLSCAFNVIKIERTIDLQ